MSTVSVYQLGRDFESKCIGKVISSGGRIHVEPDVPVLRSLLEVPVIMPVNGTPQPVSITRPDLFMRGLCLQYRSAGLKCGPVEHDEPAATANYSSEWWDSYHEITQYAATSRLPATRFRSRSGTGFGRQGMGGMGGVSGTPDTDKKIAAVQGLANSKPVSALTQMFQSAMGAFLGRPANRPAQQSGGGPTAKPQTPAQQAIAAARVQTAQANAQAAQHRARAAGHGANAAKARAQIAQAKANQPAKPAKPAAGGPANPAGNTAVAPAAGPQAMTPALAQDVHDAMIAMGHKTKDAAAKVAQMQASGQKFNDLQEALNHIYSDGKPASGPTGAFSPQGQPLKPAAKPEAKPAERSTSGSGQDRWIQIGAKNHHGGTPVKIDGEGKIEAGPAALKGKDVDNLPERKAGDFAEHKPPSLKERGHTGNRPSSDSTKEFDRKEREAKAVGENKDVHRPRGKALPGFSDFRKKEQPVEQSNDQTQDVTAKEPADVSNSRTADAEQSSGAGQKNTGWKTGLHPMHHKHLESMAKAAGISPEDISPEQMKQIKDFVRRATPNTKGFKHEAWRQSGSLSEAFHKFVGAPKPESLPVRSDNPPERSQQTPNENHVDRGLREDRDEADRIGLTSHVARLLGSVDARSGARMTANDVLQRLPENVRAKLPENPTRLIHAVEATGGAPKGRPDSGKLDWTRTPRSPEAKAPQAGTAPKTALPQPAVGSSLSKDHSQLFGLGGAATGHMAAKGKMPSWSGSLAGQTPAKSPESDHARELVQARAEVESARRDAEDAHKARDDALSNHAQHIAHAEKKEAEHAALKKKADAYEKHIADLAAENEKFKSKEKAESIRRVKAEDHNIYKVADAHDLKPRELRDAVDREISKDLDHWQELDKVTKSYRAKGFQAKKLQEGDEMSKPGLDELRDSLKGESEGGDRGAENAHSGLDWDTVWNVIKTGKMPPKPSAANEEYVAQVAAGMSRGGGGGQRGEADESDLGHVPAPSDDDNTPFSLAGRDDGGLVARYARQFQEAMDRHALSAYVDDMIAKYTWNEDDHPRGQPKNSGEFVDRCQAKKHPVKLKSGESGHLTVEQYENSKSVKRYRIKMHSEEGHEIGHASLDVFRDERGHYAHLHPEVHKAHRRKGVATRMYQAAAQIAGIHGAVLKSTEQVSDMAYQLWKSMVDRGLASGDWQIDRKKPKMDRPTFAPTKSALEADTARYRLVSVFDDAIALYTDERRAVSWHESEHPRGQPANAGEFAKAHAGPAKAASLEIPEFKKWFGDSKAVDRHGAPLELFHGSAGDSFNPKAGEPIWFTPDRDAALSRADFEDDKLTTAHLKMENPLDLGTEDIEGVRTLIDALKSIGNSEATQCALGIEKSLNYGIKSEDYDLQNPSVYVKRSYKFLMSKFDGLILVDYGMGGVSSERFMSYVVFHPNQIRMTGG